MCYCYVYLIVVIRIINSDPHLSPHSITPSIFQQPYTLSHTQYAHIPNYPTPGHSTPYILYMHGCYTPHMLIACHVHLLLPTATYLVFQTLNSIIKYSKKSNSNSQIHENLKLLIFRIIGLRGSN